VNPEGDARRLGLLGRVIGLVPFAGVALLFSFVLVYMAPTSDAVSGVGESIALADLAIPLTMALGGLLAIAGAIVIPRLALRSMRRRIDGPKRLETYVTVRFSLTAVLSVGVLLFGWVGAFMLQASLRGQLRNWTFAYWTVAALLGALPILLAWPTAKRRARWQAIGDGVEQARQPDAPEVGAIR
jgi:hypothetical protein